MLSNLLSCWDQVKTNLPPRRGQIETKRQDISAQVHHSDLSGQFGSIARTARSNQSINQSDRQTDRQPARQTVCWCWWRLGVGTQRRPLYDATCVWRVCVFGRHEVLSTRLFRAFLTPSVSVSVCVSGDVCVLVETRSDTDVRPLRGWPCPMCSRVVLLAAVSSTCSTSRLTASRDKMETLFIHTRPAHADSNIP